MTQETLPNKIPIYQIPFEEGVKKAPIRVVAANGSPFIKEKMWLTPHRKDYYLLQYVTKGTGRHWVDMIPYEFKPGILYFSSPEQVHVKENVDLYGTVITFTREFLTIEENRTLTRLPLLQNRMGAHELIIGEDDKPEFESLLHKCLTEYQLERDLNMEMLYTHIRALLIILSRLYNIQYSEKTPDLQRDLYRRFQACVEEHFRTKHEAGDYASLLQISVSHLNAVIREQSGKTVMTHVHERLVLEAKRLLYGTAASVKEIAFALGFHDTSYFNRFFKKATGVTPLAYRQDTGG